MKIIQDEFEILRLVNRNNIYSQRKLSKNLGFSLGKVNYCLRKLKNKGLVKILNFKNNKNKSKYMYLLTPKGAFQKGKLTYDYMKKKIYNFNFIS